MSASNKKITTLERWGSRVGKKKAKEEKEVISSSATLIENDQGQDVSSNKPVTSGEIRDTPSEAESDAKIKPNNKGFNPSQYSINYQTNLSTSSQSRKSKQTVESKSRRSADNTQPFTQKPGNRSAESASKSMIADTSATPELDDKIDEDDLRNHKVADFDDNNTTTVSDTEIIKQEADEIPKQEDPSQADSVSTKNGTSDDEVTDSSTPQPGMESSQATQIHGEEGQKNLANKTNDKAIRLPKYARSTALEKQKNQYPGQGDQSLTEAGMPGISKPVINGVAEHIDTDQPQRKTSSYRSSIVIGFLLLLLGFGGFATWSALAPLRSGVMASGVVTLAGERKTVQHLEGGIIQDILVQEGDSVEAGDVLIRLDGNKAGANLDAMIGEYYALLVKEARLLTEREGSDVIQMPDVLLSVSDNPNVKKLIEGEQNKFSTRLASISDQLKVYDSWQKTYKQEIAGLIAQRSAAKKQLVHINDELESVEKLYKKGLIDKPRLLELKRTAAGLNGKVGALTADIARAEQKIGEAKLRAVSLETQHQEKISSDLQDVRTTLMTIKEKLRAARDVVQRLEITAPRAGRIVGLKFHTPGGVITPSTPILDIVPGDDKLIIEASIKPIDIDIVVPGMEAQIQLSAYSMRKTPPIPGKVLQVSADRLEDPTSGESVYMAQIEIDSEVLQQLDDVKLYPGMPASVQIVSGERTAMDYLLAPIQAGLRKTWLEE